MRWSLIYDTQYICIRSLLFGWSHQYHNWRTDNVTLPKFYGTQMVRRKNFRYKKPHGYMTEYTLLIVCNIIPQLDNTSWWFRITDDLNNKRKSAINSSRLLPLGPERPWPCGKGVLILYVHVHSKYKTRVGDGGRVNWISVAYKLKSTTEIDAV